jgi:hypothetical protein
MTGIFFSFRSFNLIFFKDRIVQQKAINNYLSKINSMLIRVNQDRYEISFILYNRNQFSNCIT